jgi:hypothetical protein
MAHTLYENVRFDPAFINYVAGSTFQYSQVFDMTGFEGAACIINLGAITTGAAAPFYAEGSTSATGTFVSYYGSTAAFTVLGASGDIYLYSEVYRPRKPFIRFTLGRATANSVINGGIMMRYRPGYLAVVESTMTTAGGNNIGGWMQDYGICFTGSSS